MRAGLDKQTRTLNRLARSACNAFLIIVQTIRVQNWHLTGGLSRIENVLRTKNLFENVSSFKTLTEIRAGLVGASLQWSESLVSASFQWVRVFSGCQC
jgi:hypothetical protein